MAFEWRESFGYSTVLLDIFTSHTSGTGGHTATINATGGRTGGPCLRWSTSSSAGNSTVAQALKAIPAGTTKYVAFAYKTGLLPPVATNRVIFRFTENGTVQVDIRVNSQGDLFFTRNGTLLAGTTITACVIPGVYIQIQAKVVFNNTTGSVDVRLNGATSSSLPSGESTGLDTVNTATVTCDGVALCVGGAAIDPATGSDNRDFCHVAVRSTDWMGDIRVDYFPFNAAGNSAQWTPSTGSNHTTIDEIGSKNTADYNSESTVGEKDTFNLDNVPTTAEILEVCPMGLFEKMDAGSAEVAFVVRQGSNEYDGANFSPPFGSAQYFKEGLEENPDTSNPWTASEFNSGELGYKRTT